MTEAKNEEGKKEDNKNKDVKNDPAENDVKKVNDSFQPRVMLDDNLRLLVSAVNQKDEILLKRVLRKTTPIRKAISKADLEAVVCRWLPDGNLTRARILKDFSHVSSSAMEMEVDTSDSKDPIANTKDIVLTPEIEAYLHLFSVQMLLREKNYPMMLESVTTLLEQCGKHNVRTLDIFQAKGYQFKSRALECMGRIKEVRHQLIAVHRTACLRLDEYGQANAINLILRNYLEMNLVDQASKFAARVTFPDSVSNNQQLRYLYYMGRIQAIQLDYSLAFRNLTQAIRKSPANTGLGYRILVHKLASIVQLLMGEIPERAWFSQKDLQLPLKPYFELVKAVRNGSLTEYDQVRNKYLKDFKTDKVLPLVVRLRNSVIRAGLRRINLSYSKISFEDIASRLALENAEGAELVCAKAIRDGVIDAKIDHDLQILQSNESIDIYSTIEPQKAFHRRIQFCLAIHNDAVKAMRYAPDAHKTQHQTTEKAKTEEEIAKEIEAELNEED